MDGRAESIDGRHAWRPVTIVTSWIVAPMVAYTHVHFRFFRRKRLRFSDFISLLASIFASTGDMS